MTFISDEELKDFPKIQNTLIDKRKKRFHESGLFSERIFGAERYSCSCGKIEGKIFLGTLCQDCNTLIKEKDFSNVAVIRLEGKYKVISPIILKMIEAEGNNILSKLSMAAKNINVSGEIIKDDEDELICSFHNLNERYEEFIMKFIKESKLKTFLLNNRNVVLLSSIPIIPIHLRQANLIHNSRIQMDDINRFYVDILTHNHNLINLEEINGHIPIEYNLFEIQNTLNNLYDEIIEIISVKEGLIRDQILSNRINFSGRAVITLMEDEDDSDSCIIPREMFLEIYYLEVIKKISKKTNTLFEESDYYFQINKFDKNNSLLNEIIRELLDEKKFIILNRNPSLHLGSLQAFWIKEVNEFSVIQISKYSLKRFGADFDGDTMAVFSLTTEEAIEEAKQLLISNNIMSHKEYDFEPDLIPYQDNALGLWLLNS